MIKISVFVSYMGGGGGRGLSTENGGGGEVTAL